MTMSEIIIPGGSTHSAEGVGDRDPEEVGQEAHHEPDCIPTPRSARTIFRVHGACRSEGELIVPMYELPAQDNLLQ